MFVSINQKRRQDSILLPPAKTTLLKLIAGTDSEINPVPVITTQMDIGTKDVIVIANFGGHVLVEPVLEVKADQEQIIRLVIIQAAVENGVLILPQEAAC